MRVPAVAFTPVLVAAGALASLLLPAAAALPPVDLTGTSWHTEGTITASARGRVQRGPTYLDVEFLPDQRFSAVDPSSLTLTGGYTTAGARATRLSGQLDAPAIDDLVASLDEQLELALGLPVDVYLLSHRFRARTNGLMDRLKVRVQLRFRVEIPFLGRSLVVREVIRTGDTGTGPLASGIVASASNAVVPGTSGDGSDQGSRGASSTGGRSGGFPLPVAGRRIAPRAGSAAWARDSGEAAGGAVRRVPGIGRRR